MTARARAGGFGTQLNVLRALIVREALRNHGHENMGFFWVILEPLMFALAVALVWTVLDRNHGHPEINTVTLAVTGYISVTLWRHTVAKSRKVLRHNLSLRYHAFIRPLDIYLGHGVMEVLGCLAAFYVAYVPLSILGVIDPMRDPLLAMGGFGLHAWFCLSFGLIIASLSELSELVSEVLPVTMYITLPLTGIFTMQSWMPETARDILSWSPMVNTIELFRNGMFSADVTTYWDAWYVVWWCFAQTVVALMLFDYARRRVDMD